MLILLQRQKEILDAELEMMSKENEGSDTTELRRKLDALKQEVM